jgi:non-heme chloroperoxidase
MRVKSITLPTGVQLEYADHGPVAGTPVVLLHGVTDSWRSFEAILPNLPGDIRAFAVSLRGHGGSSRPESGYLFSDMSADIDAFLEALNVDRAVIVGHSMGASVAQRFAIDHPERVRALVLIGAFASLYREPGVTAFFDTSVARLTDPIDRSFAREWQLSTLAREIPAAQLDVFVDETLKVPSRVWKAAFSGFLSTPDFLDRLHAVTVPALLIWGDRDAFVPREHQDQLLATLPDARLTVYQGHGHAVHWEAPLRVADDISTFLARQVPAPRFVAASDIQDFRGSVSRLG